MNPTPEISRYERGKSEAVWVGHGMHEHADQFVGGRQQWHAGTGVSPVGSAVAVMPEGCSLPVSIRVPTHVDTIHALPSRSWDLRLFR